MLETLLIKFIKVHIRKISCEKYYWFAKSLSNCSAGNFTLPKISYDYVIITRKNIVLIMSN